MLDVTPFLPKIQPMSGGSIDKLPWKGVMSHIGPVSDFTPLQDALQGKTNCALYMIYVGCVGFCIRRTAPVLEQKLNLRLIEQIYCYQFDWRYPKLFGITVTDVEDRKDRVTAIRRSIAYFFFQMVKRMPSYYLSGRPIADTSFIINLTRFLCGPENQAAFDAWLTGMIARLNQIATCDIYPSPKLVDYPDRAAWEAATRLTHGKPLPPEVLDLGFDPASADLLAMAYGHLNTINPADNPLLTPADDLIAKGFTGTPYRIST